MPTPEWLSPSQNSMESEINNSLVSFKTTLDLLRNSAVDSTNQSPETEPITETPTQQPTEESWEIPVETETSTENETQQDPEKEKTMEDVFNDFFDKIMNTDQKYLSFSDGIVDYTLWATDGDESGEQCIILEMEFVKFWEKEEKRLIKWNDWKFRIDTLIYIYDNDSDKWKRKILLPESNPAVEIKTKKDMEISMELFKNFFKKNRLFINELDDAQENYEKDLEKITETTTEDLKWLLNDIFGNK